MEGISLGVMDVIHLALIDGALAGAIDEGAVLLVLADYVTLIGEQALMPDQHPIFQALNEEDMAGIRFCELDSGSKRGPPKLVHTLRDPYQQTPPLISP